MLAAADKGASSLSAPGTIQSGTSALADGAGVVRSLQQAAQSALMHQGARGYLLSSEVQRRVRESHFVAIVTPAIKHLRKEIARLSAEEMPA